MDRRKKITASDIQSYNILGTYEGEILDTNITNKNGLDITREVMETVFESEDYKEGIEYGWFIGYLGHPEDPNCMEFERGCIVMTEGYIDDNGKVYGKFNLIDTPVGQIVKKFQDAGVTFGISIRGAGDIINNSVEPDTFVFRGFDLVSFPAYPESIPKFTSIAASANPESRKKYSEVCAAVRTNVGSITSCSTIDVLKSQFAPQSEEYKALENQRKIILSKKTFNIDSEKVEAMTALYLKASAEAESYAEMNEKLKRDKSAAISVCNRKIAALKRITESQIGDITRSLDSVTASCSSLKRKNRELSDSYDDLYEENEILTDKLNAAQKTNLIYRQRIEASTDKIRSKESVISGLHKKLRETVTASSEIESGASDLDEENRRLKSDLRACKNALRAYQSAYISVYASALGVDPDFISFSDSTSVSDIQRRIAAASNTANLPSTVTAEPLYIDDEPDDNDIITL
ncbi:MAG: hypothetical protein NC320_03215 [Clostridium sp.]|nr:hypothetical protein [Clostridium sp.]